MMASKKGKKVVKQEELRRLMREKQQRQAVDKKRVESPFAKYSGLGGLSCALCAVHLKSELLWPAHVLGKAHKDKVAELKSAQHQAKRKAPDERDDDGGGGKRSKSADAAAHSERRRPSAPHAQQRSAGLTLLAGCYSDQEDQEDDENQEAAGGAESAATGEGQTQTPTPTPTPSGLPADFFDSGASVIPAAAISHSGSILKAEPADKSADNHNSSNKKDNKLAEALPEGFFDDPVRDAKVRNVDAPKDHMDKEWEEFQKEIRQVNTKSEAIVAEDDEEGRLGRQIDEIDEQIECLRRVELLRDRRDVVRTRTTTRTTGKPTPPPPAPPAAPPEDQDDDDDEELLGLLSRDWRAKGALA